MEKAPTTPADRHHGAVFVFCVLGSLATVLALLYVGRDFLIPLATAILLFTLMVAVIDRIAAWRLLGHPVPRWAAHLAGFLLVFIGVGLIILVFANQADAVIAAAPRYAARFEAIIEMIVAAAGRDAAEAAGSAIRQIDLGAGFASAAGSAGSFLSGVFLVLLYLPFLMLERAPFLRKVPLLTPDPAEAARNMKVLRAISASLQRYVGIKTAVSALTGLLTYVIVKFVGLDFAETWGIAAFLLNFIPTVGSMLGVLLPALVALVQFDTLAPFFIVVAGCGVVQFIIGNIVEPAMTGKSLNLSTFAVIFSLTFWGALWGAPGALLSVPITVALMIVCAHVPGLGWMAVLISGDGVVPGSGAAEGVPGGPPGGDGTPGK